jgi:glutamate/tyrosine decarboxylase-like PLP-dependent enzyme
MLGAPFQCSFFLVKGKNALHEANCAGAKYLFQQDKFYDVSWDTGDKSVQCGRKASSGYSSLRDSKGQRVAKSS